MPFGPMRMVLWRTAALWTLAGLSIPGCSREAADARRFPLTGVVIGREPSPPRLVVAHDAIEGLMPAMTMRFEIGASSPPARDGDRIAATLLVSGGRSWLEDVRVTGRDGGVAMPLPAASRATPGAVVPDLPLVDQDGAPITLRDAADRVRVVTFIYTRCPLPDLCPLMVRHLEAIRRRADEEGLGNRLALLGITLDPAFDTPAVLRAYGESVLAMTNGFGQWTLATGTPAQIEDAATFFGVDYRAEGGAIAHTLTTSVVSRDGRILRVFGSNAWRPDDLYDVVRRGIERVPVH
jgi:protein SCO1/2